MDIEYVLFFEYDHLTKLEQVVNDRIAIERDNGYDCKAVQLIAIPLQGGVAYAAAVTFIDRPMKNAGLVG